MAGAEVKQSQRTDLQQEKVTPGYDGMTPGAAAAADFRQSLKAESVMDQGASSAINLFSKLKAQGQIGGADLKALIRAATDDLDNNAAGGEYQELRKYIEKVYDRLDPEAKKVWNSYEDAARDARAKGQTGLPEAILNGIVGEEPQALGLNSLTPHPIPGHDPGITKGNIAIAEMQLPGSPPATFREIESSEPPSHMTLKAPEAMEPPIGITKHLESPEPASEPYMTLKAPENVEPTIDPERILGLSKGGAAINETPFLGPGRPVDWNALTEALYEGQNPKPDAPAPGFNRAPEKGLTHDLNGLKEMSQGGLLINESPLGNPIDTMETTFRTNEGQSTRLDPARFGITQTPDFDGANLFSNPDPNEAKELTPGQALIAKFKKKPSGGGIF